MSSCKPKICVVYQNERRMTVILNCQAQTKIYDGDCLIALIDWSDSSFVKFWSLIFFRNNTYLTSCDVPFSDSISLRKMKIVYFRNREEMTLMTQTISIICLGNFNSGRSRFRILPYRMLEFSNNPKANTYAFDNKLLHTKLWYYFWKKKF